ncbi:hypothetical protein CDAR_609151 [Caerostris darwini]|uniref:Uncharacterized protein n=1 Tax=Caerostris darwini TaxID=1538125 RepID=A0AAV4U445_9ARAC|nr:hypothetical protein CDAR_609151 [Caerostris darwini]
MQILPEVPLLRRPPSQKKTFLSCFHPSRITYSLLPFTSCDPRSWLLPQPHHPRILRLSFGAPPTLRGGSEVRLMVNGIAVSLPYPTHRVMRIDVGSMFVLV